MAKDIATDRALGARVRLARIEKRISQGDLGKHLGISFQQVQKYELGKDRISASMLRKIAGVLGKPIGFFFEDLDGTQQDGPALADIMDRRGQERTVSAQNFKIIRALARVPDGQVKNCVLSLIQALGADEAHQGADETVPPQPQTVA